jgi:hypothetical protein
MSGRTTMMFAGMTMLLSVVVGCSSASDAVSDTADTVTEVDKVNEVTLRGTWRPRSESGSARPATVTVQQRALSVKLIVALEGHACLAQNVIETKMTTDGLVTTADVGGMHLTVDGDPGLEEIIGNFEALRDGPCRDHGGWLSVTR